VNTCYIVTSSAGAEVHLGRSPVAQGLVRAIRAVEPEVLPQAPPGLVRRPVVFQVHVLVLDAPPQTLREDVVERPTASIHADRHTRLLQLCDPLAAGELAALVRVVEDRRLGKP